MSDRANSKLLMMKAIEKLVANDKARQNPKLAANAIVAVFMGAQQNAR